jgi:hypothetical protein
MPSFVFCRYENSYIFSFNSGAPEGEVSGDSVKSLDTEPEITSKREQGEVKTGSGLEGVVEDGEATDREVPEKRINSAKKKETRRKTLEEYFLDSPTELAVENAFQSPAVNSVLLHHRNCFLHKSFGRIGAWPRKFVDLIPEDFLVSDEHFGDILYSLRWFWVLVQGARTDGSSQGVLQAIEKNTLAEITPVLNVGTPSRTVTPFFNKTKSRR